MINCPHCNNPLLPYQMRCESCGAFVFDVEDWQELHKGPAYIKYKQQGRTVIAQAVIDVSISESVHFDHAYNKRGIELLRLYGGLTGFDVTAKVDIKRVKEE